MAISGNGMESSGFLGGLSSLFGIGAQDEASKLLPSVGLGLGQLGLGLAQYLSGRPEAKTKLNLLRQQLANNTYEIDRKKRGDEAMIRAFGGNVTNSPSAINTTMQTNQATSPIGLANRLAGV